MLKLLTDAETDVDHKLFMTHNSKLNFWNTLQEEH